MSLTLEYKYVVMNRDGGISLWKPGDNFKVEVAVKGQGSDRLTARSVAVKDAWDASEHDIEVENLALVPATAAEEPAASTNGSSAAAAASAPSSFLIDRAVHAESNGGGAAAAAAAGSLVVSTEAERLELVMRQSIKELSEQVERHQRLRQQTEERLSHVTLALVALAEQMRGLTAVIAALLTAQPAANPSVASSPPQPPPLALWDAVFESGPAGTSPWASTMSAVGRTRDRHQEEQQDPSQAQQGPSQQLRQQHQPVKEQGPMMQQGLLQQRQRQEVTDREPTTQQGLARQEQRPLEQLEPTEREGSARSQATAVGSGVSPAGQQALRVVNRTSVGLAALHVAANGTAPAVKQPWWQPFPVSVIEQPSAPVRVAQNAARNDATRAAGILGAEPHTTGASAAAATQAQRRQAVTAADPNPPALAPATAELGGARSGHIDTADSCANTLPARAGPQSTSRTSPQPRKSAGQVKADSVAAAAASVAATGKFAHAAQASVAPPSVGSPVRKRSQTEAAVPEGVTPAHRASHQPVVPGPAVAVQPAGVTPSDESRISIVCGVAKSAQSSAVGVWLSDEFQSWERQAGSGKGKTSRLPACVQLVRLKQLGVWVKVSAAERREHITPAQFLAKAGVKGGGWKAAIHTLLTDDAVGPSIGSSLSGPETKIA
ncbi:MAG: hypothetical protein WDW36_005176 [Sanguina aurantia]